MAGLQAGNVHEIEGKRVNDASITRKIIKGYRPHHSKLPPPPSANSLKRDHSLYELFKKAEVDHLNSHKKTESWTEVPSKKARREET
jgi:hypothetical protein